MALDDVSQLSDDQLAAALAGEPSGTPPTGPTPAAQEPVPQPPPPAQPPAQPEPPAPSPDDAARQGILNDLQQERDRRRRAEAALTSYHGRVSPILEALLQQQRQQAAPTQQSPTPGEAQQPTGDEYEQDPLGYLKTRLDTVAEQISEFQAAREQSARVNGAMHQFQQYVNWVDAQEKEFTKTQPSYPKAVEYMQQRRLAELNAMGIPAHQHSAILSQDAKAIATQAQQQGMSPPEYLWRMANSLGFQVAPPTPTPPIQDPAGGEPPPRSLGGTSGVPAQGGVPSAAEISSMSDDAFNALFARLTGGG